MCSQQRLAFPSPVSSSHRPLTLPHPARTQGCAHTGPPCSMRHQGGGASGVTPCSGRSQAGALSSGEQPSRSRAPGSCREPTGLLQASLHSQACCLWKRPAPGKNGGSSMWTAAKSPVQGTGWPGLGQEAGRSTYSTLGHHS